jgi:hypothetical protein
MKKYGVKWYKFWVLFWTRPFFYFDRHTDISGWGFYGFSSSHRLIFWDNTLYYSTAASFPTLHFDPVWFKLLALSSSKPTDRFVSIPSHDITVSESIAFTVNKISVMPLTFRWDSSDWPVVVGNSSVGFDRELSPRGGTTGRQVYGDCPASPASGLDRSQ